MPLHAGLCARNCKVLDGGVNYNGAMMAVHALEDYSFSEAKRMSRSQQVLRIGKDIADIYQDIAREHHKSSGGVYYKADRHEDLIGKYFTAVALFKYKHRFDLDDKINQPKMAALFVESVVEENRKLPLFCIPDELIGTDFEDAIVFEFCYALVCRTLFVNISKVPFIQKRDLIMCIDRFGADTEWIAWGMYSFCAAYGEFQDVGD